MGNSLQDVYSKNLQQSFGYPLRFPEPNSGLPESYQADGLHIGDVGFVDSDGEFNVLFNICLSSAHQLHQRGVPSNFHPIPPIESEQISYNPNAIPSEKVISSRRINQNLGHGDSSVAYEFIPSTPTGSILILPFGAVRHDLKEKEEFRRVAIEQGQNWCSFAKRDLLYLITGFHKARAWSLGSFDGAPGSNAGLIRVARPTPPNVGYHKWHHSFPADWRSGPINSQYAENNQTVLIRGFSITVRWWDPDPLVEWVPKRRHAMFKFLKAFRILSPFKLLKRLRSRRIVVEHEPRLSEPFHPSNTINRFLLDKTPEAQVAVTHDDQWINMLDDAALTYDDLAHEESLGAFLSEHYSDLVDSESHNGAVFLRSKRTPALVVAQKFGSPSELQVSGASRALEGFSRPMLPQDDSQIFITRIRADDVNVSLARLPVGFYIGFEVDDTKRRTETKPILVDESVIEWVDEILLPSDKSKNVVVTICASFELTPTLGKGETLHVLHSTVGQLLSNSQLFTLSSEDGEVPPWCSSLLVMAERRLFNQVVTNLEWEESSSLAQETDLGHDALLRYYKNYQREDLEISLAHFKHALDICPVGHARHAVVLFNLATAEFLSCQVDGTNLASPIARYQDALNLRPVGHPDRAATLLHLAQALLYRSEEQGREDSIAFEIEGHVKEIQASCNVRAHMHRAADLLSQSYQTHKALILSFADLNNLIPELEQAIRLHPEGHFDRPERLNNLSAALLRRFEVLLDSEDIAEAVSHLEDAIRSTPDGHPRKPRYLASLGNSFRIRFMINQHGEIGNLHQAVSKFEDAVRLIPNNHPIRPRYLYALADSLMVGMPYLKDQVDIDQALLRLENLNAVHDRATLLNILGDALFAHFERLGDVFELVQGVLMLTEDYGRIPGPEALASHMRKLRNAFRICCERQFDLAGFDQDKIHARLKYARAEDILTCLEDYIRSYPSPGPLRNFRPERKSLEDFPDGERGRQEAIFQLISTEADHNRDLQVIVKLFYSRLVQILDQWSIEAIFSNIEDILLTSSNFLSALEKRQRDCGLHIDRIGDLLEEHIPKLRVYKQYCVNRDTARYILNRRRATNSHLAAQLQTLQEDTSALGLDLATWLIFPVERIEQYGSLIRTITIYTDPSHAGVAPESSSSRNDITERQSISAACQVARNIIAEIDDMIDDNNEIRPPYPNEGRTFAKDMARYRLAFVPRHRDAFVDLD